MAKAIDGLRIIAGDGINIVRTRNGIVINQDRRSPSFQGAWYVSRADADLLRISRGYVNALEPVIQTRPISDPDCTLSLPKAKDAAKPRWVCIRVKVDDKGKMTAKADSVTESDLTIVVSDVPFVHSGGQAKHPVACIYKEVLWQIAYFDYQHMTRATGTRITHFFSPA